MPTNKFDEIIRRVSERRKSTTSSWDRIINEVSNARQKNDEATVDEQYMRKFFSDTESYLSRSEYALNNMSWNEAMDYGAKSRRNETITDLTNRAKTINRYLSKSNSNADIQVKISEYLDAINKTSVAFDERSKYFSNWKSQDEYDTAARQYGYSKKYDGKTSTELQDLIGSLEDGEEKEWLKSYASTVDYDEKAAYDLEAAQKEIEKLEKQKADLFQKYRGILTSNQTATTYLTGPNGSPQTSGNYIGKIEGEESDVIRQMKDLEDEINQKKQYLTLADRVQYGIKLSSVADPNSKNYDPEFNNYTGYVADVNYELGGKPYFDDETYAYINNPTVTDNRTGGEISARDLLGWNETAMGKNSPYYNGLKVETIFDFMTDDEISIYNYYYNKHGKDAAKEYIEYLSESLNARKAQKDFEKYYEGNKLLELGHSITAGLDQFGSGIANLFNGDDYIPTTYSQYLSSMVREDLADVDLKWYNFKEGEWDDANIFGSSFGQTLYDVGTTTANMAPSILVSTAVGLLNPVAGAWTGATLMGASAAGNAYADAINRGLDKSQAAAYGVAIGVSEALLEKALGGISKFGGTSAKITKAVSGIDDALLRWALRFGGSFASEALEEGLQEILDPIFQNAIFGTDEDVNWSEVAYSALLGGLSAGVFEGNSIRKDINKEQSLKTEYEGKTDALIQEGLESDIDTESYKLAKDYKAKTEGGKSLTGAEIRNILAANQEQIAPKDLKKIQKAAEARLTELGQTKDVQKLAELATKYATGQKLSKADKAFLANNKNGNRVAQELIPENIMSGEYTSEWAEGIGTKQVNKLAYNIKNIIEQMANPAVYNPLSDRISEDEKVSVSDNGKATISGTDEEISIDKKVEVVDFVKDKKTGKITDIIINANGKQVKASEIDFADADQAYLFSAVKHIENITPGDAQVIIRDYDPSSGISVGEYLNGVDEAYTYGYHGYTEADMKSGLFTTKLTDENAKSAYMLGKTAKNSSKAAKYAAIKRMRTAVEAETEKAVAEGKAAPKPKKMAVTYNEGNGVVRDFDKAGMKLSKKQRAGYEVAKILHKLGLGTNFEFFESFVSKTLKDKKGNPARVFISDAGVEEAAPAGVYMKSDGTIRIDLNAYNGKQLTLYTLAHEMTHFIQQWSTEKYEVLAEYLVSTYYKTGLTMHQRVLREQARLKGIRGEDISYNEAYDEVVANAMMKMFDDGKLVERLTELEAKDKNLAMKLWEGFKQILNELLGVYQSNPGVFNDTKDLMQMKEDFETLQGMFAEALAEASENFQANLSAVEVGVEPVVENQTIQEHSGKQHSSQETDLASTEHKINTSMTMAEAKRMIETAFKVNNIAEFYEDEYADAEDWLRKAGSDEVEMYIENDFDLQARYINSNEDILNEEYRMADVLEAYLAGTLVGKEKPKPKRLDVSQSTKLEDNRFYSPQKIEDAKATYELAIQKAVGKDANAINRARADILLFAHNKGAAELLGITQAELNKKLRSWSKYSATARDISRKINAGVAEENRWTGIENSSYINKAKVTNEDIERLVASVEGDSKGYERKYIARVMLAADTHIDYSKLKFKFASSQQVNADHNGGNRVLGFYDDTNRLIEVTHDKPHTVAHEMGHYIDTQWGRDLIGTDSSHLFLTRGVNEDIVRVRYGEPGVQFLNNFKLFINSLSDVNQNYNSYYNDRGEIFARFFARFIEWTDNIATGSKYYSYESTMYNDKFTQAQFVEFARLLQEKALLDGKEVSKTGEQYSSQETDLDTNKDTAYDSAKKKTAQEDKANGRREETREDFHRRAVQEGCTVNDRGEIAYAFRPIADWNLSENIRITKRNLREKGIQVIVCDLFEVNRNSITTQRMNAISVAGEAVYLHTAMETDPIETAEHEAYHFWKHTQARMDYFAELYKKFDFDSPAAIDLIGKIEKAYIESQKADVEIDVEVDSDESVKLIEEVFAYVTGFAASGDQLGIAHKILRDFDAVKAAWDDLIKKQATTQKGQQYSSQETDADNAPTFYSQMGKVVEGMKQDKFGASSVISMLRGRGVKAEEIRWSGIQAFLDGKKSVTKAELLDFINSSMLQIEEEARSQDSARDEFVQAWMRLVNYYVDEREILDGLNDLEMMEGYLDSLVWDENLNRSDADYLLDLARKVGNTDLPTKWDDYKLDGGSNYRELVFKMPGPDYSNQAMKAHWGADAQGVLAHARIQDFDVDGKKMLFIEEIQSDWHNEGAREGYATKTAESIQLEQQRLFEKVQDNTLSYEERQQAYQELRDFERDNHLRRTGKEVPDAPFKDNYHEYVLKRLLRMAAEEGYDSIGWTTADIQSKRWSEDYAEGYRIEYDQDIPKFLKKYGKQWGAEVGKTTLKNGEEVWSMDITPAMKKSVMTEGQALYSSQETDLDTKTHPYAYDTLVGKPDMVVTTVDVNVPKNRADVVYQAKQNAAKVGKFDPKTGSVSVYVDDINANVLLGTDGLKHGLRRTKDPQNDANYIVTMKAGEIIKNSIKVNEMNPKKVDAKESLVLIGVAKNPSGDTYVVRSIVNRFSNELTSIDALYAINAKKQELAATKSPRFTAEPLSETSSTISIAELLDLVNQYFPDVLPEDVLKHYGYDARPEGDLGKDALYSTQETDNISNRDMLANAFETLAQNSKEYEMIQQYKGRIRLLNEYEEKLSKLNAEIREITFGTEGERDYKRLRELRAKAKETAKHINRHDRELLNMEASEPLRKVIEQERKKEAQKTKEHIGEILQNKKLRAEQTEYRHKIRKVVRDLNKILKNGNKKQNVKEDLQPVVTKALQAAEILFTDNYGTYDMLRNGIGTDLSDAEEALVKTCTKMLNELDKMPTDGYDNWQARQEAENKLRTKMSNLKEVFARERKRLNNTTVSSILGELADSYAALEDSDQRHVQGAYSEPVHNFLKNLQKEVGGTIVMDMTKNQLESVYAAYNMVLNTVRNVNRMFNEELKQSREQLSNAVIEEVLKAGGVHLLGTKTGDKVSQFDWNNMKPIWLGNRIGSDTFSKLVNGLFKGQYRFAVDIAEVKKFKLDMDQKYHPREWDTEKRYEFESSTGKKFSLNLQQIMSLYAFSKRDQAYSHLRNGGFVFDENSTVVVDGKLGIKKTYIHKGATSYKLNEATLNGIINSLTAEQKAYVDEMQKFLSETMGAKGNEVSMQLYGIKMFKEKFYFPLRSSGDYMERAKEAEMKKQQGQINLVNSGFTHSVKPQAKNPIVLSEFMDVWAEHCNEMSMYHSMVLPMEDFRKVYNYTTVHDENMDSASVFQTIKDAYGKAATDYIDQLYRELNAGATVDPRETPWMQLISNFKKAAVMLSGSVVVQQFSSIGRAYAIIDPKYFVGAKVDSDTRLSVVEEMKKYAPVAIIKEMGGFDTGTKGSAKSYITAEQYGKGERIKGLLKDKQYRNDLMGFLPQWADEKTWCAIWEAAKRETKAKNPKIDVKSEEFLKLAGDRFSEVIEKTQVYDSVLARSANMRSKGGFMQMATAFMAEPTATINLLEDAIRSGNAKRIARTFGAVAVSILLNNALASIVYAMRDDDEDETFIEKYFQSFTSGIIDDLNPMSYYPFIKDVYSIFQGYDVERADMSIIADVCDGMKKAVGLLGKDTSGMDDDELAAYYKQLNEVFMGILDAGCSMFGVPVKNVRRDVNGLINAWNTVSEDVSGERNTTWLSFWDKVGEAAKDTVPVYAWTKDRSKTDKLYDAIVNGDTAYVDRLKDTYKTNESYHNAVRTALRENDPRIKEATLAEINGNPSERVRIARLIIADGFKQDDVVMAINSEINALKSDDSSDSGTSKKKGFYTTDNLVREFANGDTASAKTAKSDIISTMVANGKTREDAERDFMSDVASSAKEAYENNWLNEAKAKKLLMEYAGKDEEEATSKVNYWTLCKLYPKYEDLFNEDRVAKYNKYAKPAGISVDMYAKYINGTKGLSTRNQVVNFIHSLSLTREQKDALYLAAGYSESKIWDVPW